MAQTLQIIGTLGDKQLFSDTVALPAIVDAAVGYITSFLGREPEVKATLVDDAGKTSLSVVIENHVAATLDYTVGGEVETILGLIEAITGTKPSLVIDVQAVAA